MLKNKTHIAQLCLLLTTFIWGCTFTMVKESLQNCPPYAFAGWRFGLATVGCLFFLDWKNIRFKKNELIGGVFCGILLFSGYAFQNFGLIYTSPTKSAFITGTCIIMVPILLVILRLQAIHLKIWISVVLAIIGLFLLLNPDNEGLNHGDILTFGCALSFALHVIIQNYYTRKSRTMFLFFPQLITVSLLSFLLHWTVETQAITWSNQLISTLFITGIFATLFGIGIMVWAQKILSPSRTAIIFSMEPVFAALFAMIMIGDFLSLVEWMGGGLIIAGVIYGESGNE